MASLARRGVAPVRGPEMAAPGFWLLSVAVGCLAAGLVSLVAPGVLVPVLSFAAGTLLSLVGIRPFLLRYLHPRSSGIRTNVDALAGKLGIVSRSEEHTSELQSHSDLVCRLLLEKKKN